MTSLNGSKKMASLTDYKAQGSVLGHRLISFDEIDSTNRLALELAEQDQEPGTVVLAENQSCGRGRLGKSWLSAQGQGLYFSVILRPEIEVEKLSRLTLMAGVASAEALQPYCQEKILLKWPNDILLAGKKCGGILAELSWQGKKPSVVLGIGLNIHRPPHGFPEDIAQRAGSLADFGCTAGRGQLLAAVIKGIDETVVELEQGGWPQLMERWQQRDATCGKRCSWLNVDGQLVEGVAAGIDDQGQLFIDDDQGCRHAVLSGDVQLLA